MGLTTRTACLAAGLMLLAGGARADVLTFSYTFTNGDVLGASLTGTLLPDGNTFNVSGYNAVTYNGADVTFAPDEFQSFSDYYAGVTPSISGSGVLTLNGTYENFVDATDEGTAFDLIVGAGFPYNNGSDIGVFGFSDLGDQPFVPASFTATVATTPVPEPWSVTLVATAVLGMAGLRRRKAPQRA